MDFKGWECSNRWAIKPGLAWAVTLLSFNIKPLTSQNRGPRYELLPRILQALRSERCLDEPGKANGLYPRFSDRYSQIKELITEKNELTARVARLEAGGGGGGAEKLQTPIQAPAKKKDDGGASAASKQSIQDDFQDKKKRFRRTASEIEKHFKCPVENCQKSYG